MIEWHYKSYSELTNDELYAILKLRSEVFVVEQQCIYQDLDGIDRQSLHVMGMTADGGLACTMRIIPKGVRHDGCGSLGRIAVAKRFRGCGLGHKLLQFGLETYCQTVGCDVPIAIEAQAYLQKFYEGYGFKVVSDVFDLDGLPHIKMVHKGCNI